VGTILCQKDGRKGVVVAHATKDLSKSQINYHPQKEVVVANATKDLSKSQINYHPMEGECYTLIWAMMHFRQYLHHIHFILSMDHKPLEWLLTVLDAHGRRRHWVDMLQDFSFKIIHMTGGKHTC